MKPLLVILLSFAIMITNVSAADCKSDGIALQVLGSGGPEIQAGRASTSYLIWKGGKAKVLIDTGSGSLLRFGESGANFSDIEVVLFSHLHVDHSVDFPAFIKSSFFQDRHRDLPVYGPAGSKVFPSTTVFIKTMFDTHHGEYKYLSDFIDLHTKNSYHIIPHNISPKSLITIYKDSEMKVIAAKATHGEIPALAYRIEIDDKSIAFSGDNNGNNKELVTLAKGADIFVAHNAVPEDAQGIARNLHMPPSLIGEIAENAKVRNLVLSHRMTRTLGKEEETKAKIKKTYKGKISFADDLSCYELQ